MGNYHSRQRYYDVAADALDNAEDIRYEIGGPPCSGAILDYIEGSISAKRMIMSCTPLEANEFANLDYPTYQRWITEHMEMMPCQPYRGYCDRPGAYLHRWSCAYRERFPRHIEVPPPMPVRDRLSRENTFYDYSSDNYSSNGYSSGNENRSCYSGDGNRSDVGSEPSEISPFARQRPRGDDDGVSSFGTSPANSDAEVPSARRQPSATIPRRSTRGLARPNPAADHSRGTTGGRRGAPRNAVPDTQPEVGVRGARAATGANGDASTNTRNASSVPHAQTGARGPRDTAFSGRFQEQASTATPAPTSATPDTRSHGRTSRSVRDASPTTARLPSRAAESEGVSVHDSVMADRRAPDRDANRHARRGKQPEPREDPRPHRQPVGTSDRVRDRATRKQLAGRGKGTEELPESEESGILTEGY